MKIARRLCAERSHYKRENEAAAPQRMSNHHLLRPDVNHWTHDTNDAAQILKKFLKRGETNRCFMSATSMTPPNVTKLTALNRIAVMLASEVFGASRSSPTRKSDTENRHRFGTYG